MINVCVIHTLTKSAFFQVGRMYHSLSAVGGRLVAAGGYDEDFNHLNSVEILGESGGWSTASWSLKTPVTVHCAVEHQGKLVILGGYTYRKAFRCKLDKSINKGKGLIFWPRYKIHFPVMYVNNTIITYRLVIFTKQDRKDTYTSLM